MLRNLTVFASSLLLMAAQNVAANVVQVEEYYEGFSQYYAHFPDNDAHVVATYDDALVTGAAEEYISLESITFDISGSDAWAQGYWNFELPPDFSAKYQYGNFAGLIGARTFGATTIHFVGTYLNTSIQYHGSQSWYRVSQTGPTAVGSVPSPSSLALLGAGLALLRWRRN